MKINSNCLNIWGGGHLLAYSGLDGTTDYHEGITARTVFEGAGIEIKLPGACRLNFCDATPEQTFLTGDCFMLETAGGSVKGAFTDAYHILVEGPCTISGCSEDIRYVQEGNRTLVGSSAHFEASKIKADLDKEVAERTRWLEEREIPDGLPEDTRRALYKALSQMKTQIYSPEGLIRHRWATPDRWPHRAMWLWDSTFHAIGWRHVDLELAKEMLSAVFDGQREDGFVPLRYDPGSADPQRTQPPDLALGVKMLNAMSEDRTWVEALYPKLCAYVEWDLAHRDTDGAGLVEWLIEQRVETRSGESGMDNSSRFDAATQLDAVDFNSFLAHECEILGEFAELLGLPDDAWKWKARHEKLCALINERLWDPEQEFYMDYDVENHALSPVLASAGFLPLICGAPTADQAARLAEHIKDPRMFHTAFPVPSIAVASPEHYSKDMWRGPTWINLNWLIAYGFARYGMNDIADTIRHRSIEEIEKYYLRYGTFFEYFDDRGEMDPPQLLRKEKLAPEISPLHQVLFDYGWTATLYVDMVCSETG